MVLCGVGTIQAEHSEISVSLNDFDLDSRSQVTK